MAIDIHILNATGVLDEDLSTIHLAFKRACENVYKGLRLDTVDIVVRHNPGYVIEELGVGGFSDSINKVIYISLNNKKKPTAGLIEACMHHELYHIKRHQLLGLPNTLKERTIDEGLACLYEYEMTGKIPIYASQTLQQKLRKRFLYHLNDTENTDKWFFGDKDIPKWIGYSLGFALTRDYSIKYKMDSSKLLKLNSGKIFEGRTTGL